MFVTAGLVYFDPKTTNFSAETLFMQECRMVRSAFGLTPFLDHLGRHFMQFFQCTRTLHIGYQFQPVSI